MVAGMGFLMSEYSVLQYYHYEDEVQESDETMNFYFCVMIRRTHRIT